MTTPPDKWAAMIPDPHPQANCGPLTLPLPVGSQCPTCGTTIPQPVPLDVRAIVLDIIDRNPEARHAFRHDPAMYHGVEVVIGTLGRVAEVLDRTGRFTSPEVTTLIRDVAVACSISGGQEDINRIAQANTLLYPNPEGPPT